jgi:NitT/TauT family transport system permease protein
MPGRSRLLGALSLALLLALWTGLVRLEVYRFAYLPDPIRSVEAGLGLVTSARFVEHVAYSAYRVWTAWALAALVAAPLGLLLGWSRTLGLLGYPALEVLRPIPPIAWIPAAILFFPAVEPSVVFICFVGAFFPILLNAKAGAEQIDVRFFQAARCLGARAGRLFWDVVLPGALPSVFTGLAIGMGVAWMAVVAAEMIAGEFGLGYMIWDAYALARYPLIVVGMVVIAALGSASSAAIRWASGRILKWARHV